MTSPASTDLPIGAGARQLCYGSLAQMGDSKALPGFGQVDLDLEGGPRAASSNEPAPESGFGHLDLDVGEPDEPLPPSTSRVFNAESRPVRDRSASVHDESTRIVSGDALAMVSRPPPPGLHDDGSTRAWAEIDSALEAADETSPPRSNQSASGVATRDGRVAAMRELYARGDAAGALALASTLGQDTTFPNHTGGSLDSPDASIVVEFGEQSISIEDAFGGLIPLDDDDEEVASPLSSASSTVTSLPPGAQLTLTERQSIPRRLTALADMSKLKIDHRAGFLLAHVDGMQTLEEILDVCAMPAAEALALIANLKALGVIEFE